jgi:hypothetical protein
MIRGIRQTTRQFASVFLAVVLVVAYFPSDVQAAAIGARRVTIGSAVASAVTTYNFTFTVPSTTVIRSASFVACTTPNGTCTAPSGFGVTGSNIASQPVNMGSGTGWSASTSGTNALRIANAGNGTAPTGAQQVNFTGVTNPSATNETFFMRISTFSDATWTTLIDSGSVATATAGQITVTAIVDEALTFVLANTAVELGTLTSSTTGAGTSTMAVSTNAVSGYTVTYTGSTLTSAGNDIDAMLTTAASQQGSEQFGINLVSNTVPAIGANVAGVGTGGSAATGYNTANQFKFNPAGGDVVASSSVASNSNTFTTSYIANVQGLTPPGSYSTVITFIVTANF